MKIEFLDRCQDKNNGRYYYKGDVIEFEDSRALEIINTGYAKVYEEKEEIKEEIEDVEEIGTIDLGKLNKKQLVEMCKKLGIATSGNKEALAERIYKKTTE